MFNAERQCADVGRFAISARIPQALAEGEFTVEYQPLVRLRDQQMIGVEAMVRWDLPTGDRLPPGEFISLAEETGLIGGVQCGGLATQLRWGGAERRPRVPGSAVAQSGAEGPLGSKECRSRPDRLSPITHPG